MKYKKLLIYSPTKQIFETALANKVADEFAIAFIEEPRMIWAQGIYYPCPFTKEEITQMVTELQEKDTELETLIRTLVDTLSKRITDLTNNIDNYTINGKKISTNPVLTKTDVGLSNVTNDAQVKRSEMGTPEGVATLDNFGLVPIDQLFLKQADFYQFQDIAIIQDYTTTGEGQIIFNTRSNKFVIFQRGVGIFTNWDNADEYGTASPEGRIPFPGKIYTCEKNGKSYIWNDTTLVEAEIDESRIRPPYGIVKLAENYLVPYDQLPVEVYGELEFGDITYNPPDLFESGSAPQNPKFKDIIYCGMISAFICRFQEPGTENYKWYNNWPSAEMYGELTSNGIRPYMGVTYLDGQKHYLYQFDGHNLVKGDYIGAKRPVYSAIQGEQLEEKVNENLVKIEENTLQISNARNDITNLINSKADKTELSNVIGEEESDPVLEEIDTTGVDKIKEILVTGSEDLYIADSKLALTTPAKYSAFDDVWVRLCGTDGGLDYSHTENNISKPYHLNGLWLTRNEAIDILAQYSNATIVRSSMANAFQNSKLRTTFPLRIGGSYTCNIQGMFSGSTKFEKLVISGLANIKPMLSAFERCTSLRKIDGTLYVRDCSVVSDIANAFKGCAALEDVRIAALRCDISFADSPLLSLASISHLIASRAGSNTITITVHPDVYAKLTGDTTNAAAATLSADELAQWQEVLGQAVAKNISFATA